MKKKKTLKGMTLIEVLIAIAIMGVMTLLIAKNASIIETYNRATTRLNQKVAYERPLAETGQTADYDAAKIDDKVSIHVGYSTSDLSKYAEVKGKAYTVEEAYTEDESGLAGERLDLKFISLD